MNNIQQLNKKAFKAERAKYLEQINQVSDLTTYPLKTF
jgi:ribosomal protein L30/L7E